MIVGITKVRDESHIIQQTLDNWSEYVDQIFVYDDASTDGTPDICKEHPSVVEVVQSNYLDPDRLRAEWFNRNQILQSALRFKPEWVAYFDADEWIYGLDTEVLKMENVDRIDCQLYDIHMTPDEDEWVDPRPRVIPFFFRKPRNFDRPDQRIMNHWFDIATRSGMVKHWGKGWSVEQWEKKCEYYANEFGHPAYAPKWDARRGKGVKHDYLSDFGHPLVRWEDVCP